MIHVIVTAYNAGDKLRRTYASIRAQTETDYHIWIKDGMSTDGSVEALDDLLSEDAAAGRVTLLRGRDRGIYDAMNIALEAVCAAEKERLDARGGQAGAAAAARPTLVYFLNCGDRFAGRGVLKRVQEAVRAYRDTERKAADTPAIWYGDVYEEKTGQRVTSNPVMDDFACYRNVPCHQACFYDLRLLRHARFDARYRVRADYEQFLRCLYREGARAHYLRLLIACYEGGGFSETRENRRRSEQERRQIIAMYLPKTKIRRYDLIRLLTLAPLRTFLAEHALTAGPYNRFRSMLYRRKRESA